MKRNSAAGISILKTLGVFVTCIASTTGWAQDRQATYLNMAPLDQYLMTDRNAEIAMARSAAPKAISNQAKILVLGRHGYETASEGTNGWVCMVERAWVYANDFPEFWNPKIRGPVCLNPPAVRSILPISYKTTEMALAGRSKGQIIADTEVAFVKKELPSLEPEAMSYMMSKEAYLTDEDDHNMSHLMFYTPHMDPPAWGANLLDSPVERGAQIKGTQPIDILLIPLNKWSDGTAVPS